MINLITLWYIVLQLRDLIMAVDEKSQEFLRVLIENGGEANTTTIRSKTGMSRGQVNHRFRKLEDLDWIEIDREESGKGDRTPPKIAILTDDGEQAIRSGDAGQKVLSDNDEEEEDNEVAVSKDQLKEFHQEIDGVKNRLNVVVEQMNKDTETKGGGQVSMERIEKLEREVARLRETVELLNEAVSQETDKSDNTDESSGDDSVDTDVIRELRDQQEYLEEWMDVAQKHLIAVRIYMNENDEDFESYLKEAGERNE